MKEIEDLNLEVLTKKESREVDGGVEVVLIAIGFMFLFGFVSRLLE